MRKRVKIYALFFRKGLETSGYEGPDHLTLLDQEFSVSSKVYVVKFVRKIKFMVLFIKFIELKLNPNSKTQF